MTLRICAVIVDSDIKVIKAVESHVNLFEVRMDLIGAGWREVVKQLDKPWLACNRSVAEGGRAPDNTSRIEELLEAMELGARIVDVEFRSKDIDAIIPRVKPGVKCLISYHHLSRTPPINRLKEIVTAQLYNGADICKIVTTAQSFEDNVTVLKLFKHFPRAKVVAFAMGEMGMISRILCPVVGGYFTYASISQGKESAPGQMTVKELSRLYKLLRK